MVAADFHHALFALVEFHALDYYAVNACRRQPGDTRHNVSENLRHIGLYPNDYPLHSGRKGFHHFQPLLVGRCPRFERVVLTAYHADLHDAVALFQQVEVFRVYDEPALCADDEWVARLCQQL